MKEFKNPTSEIIFSNVSTYTSIDLEGTLIHNITETTLPKDTSENSVSLVLSYKTNKNGGFSLLHHTTKSLLDEEQTVPVIEVTSPDTKASSTLIDALKHFLLNYHRVHSYVLLLKLDQLAKNLTSRVKIVFTDNTLQKWSFLFDYTEPSVTIGQDLLLTDIMKDTTESGELVTFTAITRSAESIDIEVTPLLMFIKTISKDGNIELLIKHLCVSKKLTDDFIKYLRENNTAHICLTFDEKHCNKYAIDRFLSDLEKTLGVIINRKSTFIASFLMSTCITLFLNPHAERYGRQLFMNFELVIVKTLDDLLYFLATDYLNSEVNIQLSSDVPEYIHFALMGYITSLPTERQVQLQVKII